MAGKYTPYLGFLDGWKIHSLFKKVIFKIWLFREGLLLWNNAKILQMLMAKLNLTLTYLKCQSQQKHPTRVVPLWPVATIWATFLERHTWHRTCGSRLNESGVDENKTASYAVHYSGEMEKLRGKKNLKVCI